LVCGFASFEGGEIGPTTMAMGKPPDPNPPYPSLHQEQITQSPWTLLTVSSGPPERSRTRSPLWNRGVAWPCIAVFDCAAPARAVTAHGALSATPSVAAIAIAVGFVNISMAESRCFQSKVWMGHDGITFSILPSLETCCRDRRQARSYSDQFHAVALIPRPCGGRAPARAKALAADATEMWPFRMVLGKIIALFPERCRGFAVLYGG
jgi:hypothetical protein